MAEILERPQQPARHRLDVDAYYKMAEAGILERAARTELIDGEIIDMPAIGSPHAGITYRVNRFFARADVLLLVEVSDGSLSYDRDTKLALYARFGVPEVWIVDIAGASVEVFRDPRDGGYFSNEQRTSGMLSPALVPGIAIDVAALVA